MALVWNCETIKSLLPLSTKRGAVFGSDNTCYLARGLSPWGSPKVNSRWLRWSCLHPVPNGVSDLGFVLSHRIHSIGERIFQELPACFVLLRHFGSVTGRFLTFWMERNMPGAPELLWGGGPEPLSTPPWAGIQSFSFQLRWNKSRKLDKIQQFQSHSFQPSHSRHQSLRGLDFDLIWSKSKEYHFMSTFNLCQSTGSAHVIAWDLISLSQSPFSHMSWWFFYRMAALWQWRYLHYVKKTCFGTVASKVHLNFWGFNHLWLLEGIRQGTCRPFGSPSSSLVLR